MSNSKDLDRLIPKEWFIWTGYLIIPLALYPLAIISPWISDRDVHTPMELEILAQPLHEAGGKLKQVVER